MQSPAANIQDRIHAIKLQIEQGQQQAANSRPVTLLAVSKTKPSKDIRAAFNEGINQFGENYLQEALEKMAELNDLAITWHFIGPIQSNKTKAIAEHFDWVQSIDRLKVAQKLNDCRPDALPPLNVLIQVNISGESAKSGLEAKSVIEFAEQLQQYPRLKLRGLMTIPAASSDHQQLRADFTNMAKLMKQLQSFYQDCDTLSMGMSNDFTLAIQEGATLVRIGSALFGHRR